MDIVMKIKLAETYSGITEAELARRLGYKSQQAFAQRMKTGKFTGEELSRIASALGASYTCFFEFPDGTKF